MASAKEMIWAITGGSGQLGSSLSELLEFHGKSFISLSHRELDVSNKQAVDALISIKPDLIVNCAAWTNVDLAESNFDAAKRVNEGGVLNVSRAAKSLDIPLIHISTDYVFSGDRSEPWKPYEAKNPISKYGQTKALGEEALLATYREGSVILRTAWLYGSHGNNFAKTMIRKATKSTQSVRVVKDQIGQPTSTEDLAKLILQVAETGLTNCILHATNSGETSWYEFAREIFVLCGEQESRVKAVPSSEFPTPAKRPSYSVLDHSNWIEFGLASPRAWKEALVEIFPKIKLAVEKESKNG